MGNGTFKITIAPNGKTFKIDVDGVIGTKCTDLTRVFELGEIVAGEKKAEFYMETEDNITIDGRG